MSDTKTKNTHESAAMAVARKAWDDLSPTMQSTLINTDMYRGYAHRTQSCSGCSRD